MSTPIVNTEGTRSSSSSSDSFGSVIDSTARNMRVHRADAIALSASQVMSRSRIEKLNPFEFKDEALFPEWYYCFKQNFSSAVPSGSEFCEYSFEDYRLSFYGSGEAIDTAVTAVQHQFNNCLKILLDKKPFVKRNQFLNRDYVENALIPKIDWTILRTFTFRQLFTLSSIKMNHKQLKQFCESITEAKESSDDIEQQITNWYNEMEDSKPSWRPTKDNALQNDSKYDMTRTMGNNHHAKASGRYGKQGNSRKKPFNSNSEVYTSARSKHSNNERFVADKTILHMSKNEDVSIYSTCIFILDTGSDVHTVNDKSLLTNVRPISQTINIGNPRPVDTIGTLKIQFKDGHQQILPDVYYIPYLPNILSFHGLGDIGLPVSINENREVINTHTQQVVSGDTDRTIKIPVTILPIDQEIPNEGISDTSNFQSDPETQNIFEISTPPSTDPLTGDSSDSESVFSDESISDTESSELSDDASSDEVDKLSRQWHNTLGHPGESQFKAFKQMLNLPKSVVHVPLIQCRGCCTSKTVNRFAKQSRGHTSITRPFEVIHVDVCGPFDQPKAHDNARYFLTIVDRVSRFVTAIPLARKSETSTMIKSFLSKSYTDLRASHFPKQLRSDNGSEILNDNLKEFLIDKGIDLRLTHPHSSAENGIAERMHRTLQDKARTQMAHGNIPPIFWSEAIRYAAFLLNWTPRVNLKNKAPIHLWHATDSLTCPKLYPFGCTAFVTIPLELRTNKLAPNALECVYLGPDIQRTGHRFFSYDLMKVFGSDQALFRPNEFYFLTYANPIMKLPTNHNRLPTAYLPGIKIPPSFRNLSGQDLYCDTNTLSEIFNETKSKDSSVTTLNTDTPSVVPEVSTTPLNSESSPMPPRKAAKKKSTSSPSTSVAQLPVTSAPNLTKPAPASESPSPSPHATVHTTKAPTPTKRTSSSSSTTSSSSSTTPNFEPRYHTRSVTRARANNSVLPTKGGSEPNARSLIFPDKIQYMKASDSKKRSHANILLVQTVNQVGKSGQQETIPTRDSILHAATMYAENKLNHSKRPQIKPILTTYQTARTQHAMNMNIGLLLENYSMSPTQFDMT
ncbi:Integrase core domain family protein [Clavispora lusitaniae]|uniref:Integrase core domain family protein n=1 Tax=Clavispora lusitaniae TaxID=36911 RepID=UPI00202C7F1F|nr:Integrase core domain family protein [Clavispora lusitaniae]